MTMPPGTPQHDRLRTLDGFRALAILAVIGFHYFARWAPPQAPHALYPYGALGASWFPFRYGYLGVELFFIISGFVISMTLFRSRSFGNFVRKRFARLFPTMLLCSILSFVIVSSLPQHALQPRWRDFLPSLTFTDPLLWSPLFGVPFHAMDGSYWSLFVEVKFYFWIGLLYFGVGSRRFFAAVALGIAALVAAMGTMLAWGLSHTWALNFVFALDYLPWFVAGVGFYALYCNHRDRLGWLLLLEAVLAVPVLHVRHLSDSVVPLLAMAVCYVLFLLMLLRPRSLAWLSARPLAAVGMASYSLYLLHQDIGVAVLASIREAVGPTAPWTAIALPLGLVLLLTASSLAIYRYWEAPAKDFLLHWRWPGRAAAKAEAVAVKGRVPSPD